MTTLRDALIDAKRQHEADRAFDSWGAPLPESFHQWADAILDHPAMRAIAEELEQARKDAPKVALAEAVEELEREHPSAWSMESAAGYRVTIYDRPRGQKGPWRAALLDALRAAKGERS